MSHLISRVRRNRATRKVAPQTVTNSHIRHEPSSLTKLSGPTNKTNKVIFVDEQNVVLVGGEEEKIWIYDLNTNGQPKAVFRNHSSFISGLAQLDTDLVASISCHDHLLLTWRVSDIQVVGHWNSNRWGLTTVAKLDDTHILVGDWDGGVTVLKHNKGTSFQIEKSVTNAHSAWIHEIAIRQTVFVTCSDDKSAIVWDANSFRKRATLKHDDYVHSVAITDEHIVTASWDQRLRFFEKSMSCSLQLMLCIPRPARDIQFLDDDIVAIAFIEGFFGFISISQKSFLSIADLSNESAKESDHIYSFAVLPNARIAVAAIRDSSKISDRSEIYRLLL